MSDIEIEIDGKTLSAKPNAMIIQVADEAGIYIPRFCYHKHLSVAANCRMCLVEVEKAPKPMPACATPVMPGMKVFTKSPKALAAQKAVMEFLLINHPLDCPICDQGGECELQDLSLGFGGDESFFHEGKRTVKDKEIGPLIATEMTRCIQCTRCVRFGTEVAGIRELGALGRGGDLEIGTYIDHAMRSEVSGNVIDICPVGALTSKPFRFTARAWELQQRPSVSPHDCVGSHLNVHTRQGRVMRVVPREKAELNQTWISDRDRYSYEALYHADRLAQPMIKKDGAWQEADWETALTMAANALQSVIERHGADQLAALCSPNASTEEAYLLQKLLRGLGSQNIDHRLRQVDTRDQAQLPLYLGIPTDLDGLEAANTIYLIGSDIQREQPVAGLRVRKAALRGAHVLATNVMDYDSHFSLAAKQIVAPDEILPALFRLANALLRTGAVSVAADCQAVLAGFEPTAVDIEMAARLRANPEAYIVLGAVALQHPEASLIRAIAHCIAHLIGARIGVLTEGANAAGVSIAGALPHRAAGGLPLPTAGLSAHAVWDATLKAYMLLNVEPDLDCANPRTSLQALQQAECVIAFSLFKSASLLEVANVILPIAAYTETAGTYVNASGAWQTVQGVADPFENARPAWKVLRVLGNLLHLPGFEFDSADAVLQELQAHVTTLPPVQSGALSLTPPKTGAEGLVRLGAVPIYATDSLVRRAPALQAAQCFVMGHIDEVRVHPKTASRLTLTPGKTVLVKQGHTSVSMRLACDERLPERAVYVAAGIAATTELESSFGPIELHHEKV